MAQHDIIVFGATSFVGKILCRYLLDTFGDELNWAAAARSRGKLDQLISDLGPKAAKLPTIVADASDDAALKAMCEQTRVVVSTVGPYALYGEPLIRACVETGTDYCDLTGEVQWIRRMITAYESEAKKSGARIVHCCGFDSIPSDLGVYFTQQRARELLGAPCVDVQMRVKAARGGASGGTVASLMNVVAEATRDAELRRELQNPYSICPSSHQPGLRQPNVKGPVRDKDFNAWIAPFVMAAINTRIVHRSNALLGDQSYGKNFVYGEAMMMGQGVSGALKAAGFGAGLGGFMAAAAIPPGRWLLGKVLPEPGEGPSEEEQKSGFYDLRFLGRTEAGRTIRTKVTGDQDPGYGSTAKMLGQSAACLAFDSDAVDGGFWTPASIFGDKLIDRLEKDAGLTFEVLESD